MFLVYQSISCIMVNRMRSAIVKVGSCPFSRGSQLGFLDKTLPHVACIRSGLHRRGLDTGPTTCFPSRGPRLISQNEIPEDEWLAGLEFWAREYLKAEGTISCLPPSAEPFRFVIVGRTARAEEGIRGASIGSKLRFMLAKHSLQMLISQTTDDTDDIDPSEINVEAHFSVIDAFEMPPVHFDPVRSGFTTSATLLVDTKLTFRSRIKPSMAGQASSRSAYLRERWGIIREVCRSRVARAIADVRSS